MPGVEIAVADVRKKTRESTHAADSKRPPCPRLAVAQRKFREPDVQQPQRDQYSAECHSVMKHEMHDPALMDGAQLPGIHPQVGHVVRQKMARRRLKQSEPTAQ